MEYISHKIEPLYDIKGSLRKCILFTLKKVKKIPSLLLLPKSESSILQKRKLSDFDKNPKLLENSKKPNTVPKSKLPSFKLDDILNNM